MHHQKFPNDLVLEIISRLPLKFAFQCKVLSKSFNTRISDPKFRQTLSQHQKISTLIHSTQGLLSQSLHKISINSTTIAATHFETTLPVRVKVLAISNGLILLDFNEFMNFCVFNPITGEHQLIPYPDCEEFLWGMSAPGFATDYPTSDEYMLVTINMVQQSYRFDVFSSTGSGVWSRLELGEEDVFLQVNQVIPVYVHDSIHWIRADERGGILAFHTKKIEATFIDLPEMNIDCNAYEYMKWLGVVHGLLTLICTLPNSIVISSYDYASNKWSSSYSMKTNKISSLDYYNYSFPVWIDRQVVFFLAECPPGHDHDHNCKRKRYQITPAVENDCIGIFYYEFYTFTPTLASVRAMLSHSVQPKDQSSITATLDDLKTFIRNNTW